MRTQARKAIGPLIVGMILGMVVAARAEGPGKRDFPPPVPGWYPSGTLGDGRPGWVPSGGGSPLASGVGTPSVRAGPL